MIITEEDDSFKDSSLEYSSELGTVHSQSSAGDQTKRASTRKAKHGISPNQTQRVQFS